MKILLLITTILFTSITIGQVFEWAKHIQAEDGSSESMGVMLDHNDGVYSFGYFDESQDFDPGMDEFIMMAPDSENSGFVQKLDKNGDFEWAIQLDNDNLEISGVDFSSDNKVYILGHFKGTIDLDPSDAEYLVESPGRFDIFLICLDEEGAFLFAQTMGELANNDVSRDIVLDQDDNIYVAGYFNGVSTIIKYNSVPSELWRYESIDMEFQTNHLAVNSDNTLIASGTFTEDTIDIDISDEVFEIYGHPGLSAAYFIMQLNEDGSFEWAQSIGGEGDLFVYAMVTDEVNDIYFAGGFNNGDIDVDPGEGTEIITAGVQADCFILKLNNTGNFEWVSTYGNDASDYAYDLEVKNEKVYVTGEFNSSVDFDSGDAEHILTSNGGKDAFIQVLHVNGTFQWAQHIGGTHTDSGYGIASDEDGSIYTVGKFQKGVDFDPQDTEVVLESLDGTDAFIQKLNTSLGLSKVSLSPSLTAFPSPVNETLYLRNTFEMKLSLSLFGIDGHEWYTETTSTGIHSIDVSYLPSGMYLLRSMDEEGVMVVQKVIKQ